VFLVADFGSERAEQVLALAEGVRGYSPKGRQARQGSTPGAGYSPATSGAVTSKWAKGGGPAGDEHYNLVATHVLEKSACLETTNHDYSRADGFTAVAFNWQEGPSGDLGVSDADTGGSPPVRVSQTLAVAHGFYANEGSHGMGDNREVSPAIKIGSGLGIPSPPAVASASVVRRLTPVECCRLQGFPDDWNSEGIDAKGKRFSMADAPRYRQLGNAVTVNVANWIANNLVKAYEVAE
jgi:site-specific DNA-cytosine methylase